MIKKFLERHHADIKKGAVVMGLSIAIMGLLIGAANGSAASAQWFIVASPVIAACIVSYAFSRKNQIGVKKHKRR